MLSAGDLRPLSGSVQKNAKVFCQELDVAARTVFEDESESAGSADSWNGGRRKTESNGRGQIAQFLVQMGFERLKLLGSCRALIPRLEGHKKGRVITGANKTEQTEADEAGRVLDSRCIDQDFFHISGDGGRAFQRSSVGQLHD